MLQRGNGIWAETCPSKMGKIHFKLKGNCAKRPNSQEVKALKGGEALVVVRGALLWGQPWTRGCK